MRPDGNPHFDLCVYIFFSAGQFSFLTPLSKIDLRFPSCFEPKNQHKKAKTHCKNFRRFAAIFPNPQNILCFFPDSPNFLPVLNPKSQKISKSPYKSFLAPQISFFLAREKGREKTIAQVSPYVGSASGVSLRG